MCCLFYNNLCAFCKSEGSGVMIQNGFTYIAFLMFLAGILLAAEKYTKWKVFNYVPPLVWIYVLNMLFCTIGMFDSEGCSAAFGV